MPPDFFFNENSAAPHCNFLKEIAEFMPKLDYNKDQNIESNVFELFMVLYVDEINIQSRHLF